MSWLSQAWRATAPAFLGGGPKEGEAGTTISVSQRGANVGLKRIHGKRRVSATTVFKTPLKYNLPVTVVNHDNLVTRGFSEGTESAHRWLHRIDVWGQGPITSINKYWLDKDPHTADRFDDRNYFRALEYYGADDQTAYSDLTSKAPLWDANHRGRGVGYSATRFFNHADKPQFNAEPQLDAEIEGLPFYDARKDGTQAGGVGAHRLADPATWEWSDNNAVGLHNELIAVEGRNLPASRVNVASFQAGADKCDVQVAIPARLTNDTGAAIPKWWEGELGQYINIDIGALYPTYRRAQTGATQKRLTSNIVLDPADGARNNILKLLAGMRASLPFSQGQYKLVIEDAGASIMDFDEDSIFGGLTISSGGRADRLNQVTIEFPNENLDYQQDLVIWPAKGGAEHDAYVAEDNGEPLHKKISVESITDFYRAQDFAEFLVRSSRVNLSCEALLAPKACLLEYGDIIDLTHSTPSWAAKLFVVRNVEVQASRKGKLRLVKVKLDEYDPSDYPWSAKSNEPLQAPTNLPDPWADLPAVTGLGGTVINETNSDGSIGRYLDMVWTRPDDVPDEVMAEIAWKEDTDPIYSNFVKIDPAAEAYRINGLFDSVDYTIRHRYWNQLGTVSADAEVVKTMTPPVGSKLAGIAAGADVTGANTAAAIAGQGDLATQDAAAYATQVSGTPGSLGDVNAGEGAKLGGIAPGADVTGANTAAAIAGQGDLATQNAAAYATQVSGTPGSLSDVNTGEGAKLGGIAPGADVTAANTAAAIAGQGDLATQNAAAYATQVSGTPGSLSDVNAGEGAKLGGIAAGATNNTGALANLDTVDTAQIDNDAVETTKVLDQAINRSERWESFTTVTTPGFWTLNTAASQASTIQAQNFTPIEVGSSVKISGIVDIGWADLTGSDTVMAGSCELELWVAGSQVQTFGALQAWWNGGSIRAMMDVLYRGTPFDYLYTTVSTSPVEVKLVARYKRDKSSGTFKVKPSYRDRIINWQEMKK